MAQSDKAVAVLECRREEIAERVAQPELPTTGFLKWMLARGNRVSLFVRLQCKDLTCLSAFYKLFAS